MAMLTIENAIYAKLSGGTALTTLIGGTADPRIYNLIAPNDADLPYVVFYLADGRIPNESPRQDADYVVRVDAWSKARATSELVQTKIFDLLVDNSLSVSGWGNYSSKCRRIITEASVDEGVIYYRHIGEYQFKLVAGD